MHTFVPIPRGVRTDQVMRGRRDPSKVHVFVRARTGKVNTFVPVFLPMKGDSSNNV